MANVFSVVALAIMFREALEAAIIISVMLQLCDRLKLQSMKKTGASDTAWQLYDQSASSSNRPADFSLCLQCGLARCWVVAYR